MTTPDPQSSAAPEENLGRLLARLRNDRGLVQKRVAQLAGIDGSTLSRLESGERGVSRDVLDRLSTVLELNRRERLDVFVAAGLVSEEAARLLADGDLAGLARLLADPTVQPADLTVLRQYVRLALAHARALGYSVDRS